MRIGFIEGTYSCVRRVNKTFSNTIEEEEQIESDKPNDIISTDIRMTEVQIDVTTKE